MHWIFWTHQFVHQPQQHIIDIKLHREILNNINFIINIYGSENPEYHNLSNVLLTKKLIKQLIITKVYNITINNICDQIKNNLKSIKIKNKI